MNGKMYPFKLEQLLKIILHEYKNNSTIFGIPEEIFYKPWIYYYFDTKISDLTLHNPIGLSAGPHTQLAQNIVAGWLCGARYFELKTIQGEELTSIRKPSIYIPYEGYNCEWSQELSIKDAYDQYLNAWILIHILNDFLYIKKGKEVKPGTVFSMSLGYTLDHIRSDEVNWFIGKMTDCRIELNEKINSIAGIYPQVRNIEIPHVISNIVTLTPKIGCSPREVGYMVKYLMTEKKLHIVLKFNPTLLGLKSVKAIINKDRGFDVTPEESAFKNDLTYSDVVDLIPQLRDYAAEMNLNLFFKIANTLECKNPSKVFPVNNERIFLSGYALYPIAVNIAANLQDRFDGELDLFFSGGADYNNVPDLIRCGFKIITVSTDLLKPGGYGRLAQYFERLSMEFAIVGAMNIYQFIMKTSVINNYNQAQLKNLKEYALETLNDEAYKKNVLRSYNIKTSRKLTPWDCIAAPCISECSIEQHIPEYLWYTSKNDFNKALQYILWNNPFPSVTGKICQHQCQTKCTRIHYDDPLLIREIKSFVAKQNVQTSENVQAPGTISKKIAIIGAGPAGLSCAWFLSQAGFKIDIFNRNPKPGGSLNYLIPAYHLSKSEIERDIQFILQQNINFYPGVSINTQELNSMKNEYDYVVIATGISRSFSPAFNETIDKRIINPFDFLRKANQQQPITLGNEIAVIGGGPLAVECARTAKRLAGENSNVFILFEKSISEMTAGKTEIQMAIEEGIKIIDNQTPEQINFKLNNLIMIEHTGPIESSILIKSNKNTYELDKLSNVETNQVMEHKMVQHTTHTISKFMYFDHIIPASELKPVSDLLPPDELDIARKNYHTRTKNVFAIGGMLYGEAGILRIIADGRKVAQLIIENEHINFPIPPVKELTKEEIDQLKLKKFKRKPAIQQKTTPPDDRFNFNPVVIPRSQVEAINEASRCLQCDVLCNLCVMVCPNLAFVGFEIDPEKVKVPVIKVLKNSLKVEYREHPGLKQKFQVLNIADWCNECGNCTNFCPTAGVPYTDKIRVHFNQEGFKSDDNCFYITSQNKQIQISCKKHGNLSVLSEMWDAWIYENDNCMIILNRDSFEIEHIDLFNNDIKSMVLDEIAEMKLILDAIPHYIPRE